MVRAVRIDRPSRGALLHRPVRARGRGCSGDGRGDLLRLTLSGVDRRRRHRERRKEVDHLEAVVLRRDPDVPRGRTAILREAHLGGRPVVVSLPWR